MVLIAITADQKAVWGKILKKADFVEVSSGRNGNTGNVIHLYSKVVHKIK